MDRSVESFFEVAVIPYYEHRLPETLTDAGWRDRLGKPDAPQRPNWSQVLFESR